jgi:putative transposase
MARKTYGPEQIIGMLREADVALGQGRSVGEVCRGLGITSVTY